MVDSASSISISSVLSSTDQTGVTDTSMEVEDVASDMLGIKTVKVKNVFIYDDTGILLYLIFLCVEPIWPSERLG